MASVALAPEGQDRPAFVVHGWKHVAAVLEMARELKRPIWLLTPVGASYSFGVGFWAAIQQRIDGLFPDLDVRLVLDCDDAPGHVMAAFRSGLRWLIFRGNEAAHRRLEDMARASGAAFVARPKEALDLIAVERPRLEIAARLGHQPPT